MEHTSTSQFHRLWIKIKPLLGRVNPLYLSLQVGGIREALVFPRNADFHPGLYIHGLAEAFIRHGGRIYEGTKAWTAEGDCVETADGKKVTCDAIVMATNSPINHNLAIHARQLAYRSYAMGMLAPKAAFRRADYWSTEEPYHYVRADDWDEDHWLIIVGKAWVIDAILACS